MKLFFAYAAETKFTSGDRLLLTYDDRLGIYSEGEHSASLIEWVAGDSYSNERLANHFENQNLTLSQLPHEENFDCDSDLWFLDDDGFILFNLHANRHGLTIKDESFNVPDEIRHLGEQEEGISLIDLEPVSVENLQQGDALVFESTNYHTVEQITFEVYDSMILKKNSSIYLRVDSYIKGFHDVILHGKRPSHLRER